MNIQTLTAKAAAVRRAPETAPSIEPEPQELIALALANLITATLFFFGRDAIVNVLTPLLLVVIGSWGMWRLVTRSPAAVWTPLFSARAAAVVYLGLGNLLPEWAGVATLDYVQALYAYSPQEAAKTNLVIVTGLTILMVSIKAASALMPARPSPPGRIVFSEKASFRLGMVFLSIGFGSQFLIAIPSSLAVISFTVPGSVMVLLSSLNAVGIFLVTLWAAEKGGARYLAVFVCLAASLIMSLILMEKVTFMMALLLVGLAFLLKKVTLLRVVILTVALGGTLAVLDPAIGQVRVFNVWQHGGLTGGTVGERLGYYRDYVAGERVRAIAVQEQSSLVRIAYMAPSAFVVSQFDAGLPSDTIENSFMALIPRFIWPDKPILSSLGTELNMMLTGYDTSSLGTAVFADAYWNLGWPALLLFVPMGFFLWWASWVSRDIVETRNWLLMPFVLVVFRIGMSMDNAFVMTWLAPAAIAVFLYVVLKLGSEMVLRRTPPPSGREPALSSH